MILCVRSRLPLRSRRPSPSGTPGSVHRLGAAPSLCRHAPPYARDMTNDEREPQGHDCQVEQVDAGVELIEPRDVPLGGPRAMTVRRTLPSRQRSLIGPFCFADHYGPDAVEATGGMDVPPHPHIGLQTVTWLFEGRVLHQDALGSVQEVRPGQLNLMTAGNGICHSEEGTVRRFPDQRSLHGVQLWTALPESTRHGERAFEHVAEVPTVI